MAANSKASGFSWADEVEKEEAEAQAQVQGPQKSNPFGCARPREIVLQEKGINWRKLDEQLQSSNIRKEKQPAATPSANEQKRHPSRSGIVGPYPAQIQQMACSAVCIKQHIQNSLVPPLRYPPKNVTALMENGNQRLCVIGPAASERENENYKNIGGYLSCQPMQPSNVYGMRAWEEKENQKSECGREFFGNMSSNPPAELQMNRGSILGAGFHGNVDGGSAYAIKNIKESNFNCGNPRGGQLNMKKADAARNYKDRAGRLANGEASSVNTDGVGGRKKFHSESRNFEGNYKKRGQIASAAGVNNCQQKRRR
ncbi:hypothetical protein ACLOJK_017695 [Asimina triloba]